MLDLTIRLPQSKFYFDILGRDIKSVLFSSMIEYSTVSTSEAAYIIGGTYSSDIIAEFKSGNWQQFGTLSKERAIQGSIKMGNEFMVIGGYSFDSK